MISSMTAFARVGIEQPWGNAVWELRSVNHRYLDLSFKISESFKPWEMDWRNLVNKALNRGKIECYLTFHPSPLLAPSLLINTNLIDQLLVNCQSLAQHTGVDPTVTAMELLRWPEVVQSEGSDLAHLQQPLTELLLYALNELAKTREREGTALKAILETKLQQIAEQIQWVKEILPESYSAQKQKLTQKLLEIQQNIDPQRLEQELVFYIQKIDVDEEIERLVTHIKETHRVLNQGGPCGRRLDFLMQEMGREANTLGAKSADSRIIQTAIELKVLIEQMREQIQNVE